MNRVGFYTILILGILPVSGLAADEVSVERGLYVSIIGGCHDCHTEGYKEADGVIDPEKALKGSSLGWRGPWGTTYAVNLRDRVSSKDENTFVWYMKHLKSNAPMPWYDVRAMTESDLRSLYRYIKSLGPPGEPAPAAYWAGEPKTPYITIAPPTLPRN